jgi:hypothetical protein
LFLRLDLADTFEFQIGQSRIAECVCCEQLYCVLITIKFLVYIFLTCNIDLDSIDQCVGKKIENMCQEIVTTFTCGHQIRSVISCSLEPSDSQSPSKQPCAKLEEERHHLYDTCSACHPPFLVTMINNEHASIRSEFLALLKGAQTTKDMLEIQRCIHQNEQARRAKVAEVGKISWSGIVDWESKRKSKQSVTSVPASRDAPVTRRIYNIELTNFLLVYL